MRDKYASARKEMKKNSKSETSSKAVAKAEFRFETLQLMQRLDEFIKPRKSKNNLEPGAENNDPYIGTNSKIMIKVLLTYLIYSIYKTF